MSNDAKPFTLELMRARAEKAEAERDELRKRVLDACHTHEDGERVHAGGRLACGQCYDSLLTHFRNTQAERDEARASNAALREALDDLLASEEGAYDAPTQRVAREKARAALSSTKEKP